MEILTPLQKTFVHKFSQNSFQESFFLTGGTALAAFYPHHRLSEDLDFFTESPEEIRQISPWLKKVSQQLKLRLEIRRQTGSFIDCFWNKELQIQVDNLTDIASNKLSALYDRAESKDFVDLYFLDREFLPFEKILEKARRKHVGIDDYWLAQALQRVETIQKLPRMLKPIEIASLKTFFLERARKLIDR